MGWPVGMPTLLLDNKTKYCQGLYFLPNYTIISITYIIPKQNVNAGRVFCLTYLDKIILKFMWKNKQMEPVEESFQMKSDE